MPRRRLKDSIALLLQAGYAMPPGYETLVQDAENRQGGIVEIWRCKGHEKDKDKHDRIEVFVKASTVICKCGKRCTKVWSE